MITRKEYMQNICRGIGATKEQRMQAHREYFAQFVGQTVINHVVKAIGMEEILNSTDEYMNDIPLASWDRVANTMPGSAIRKLHEAEDINTLANRVCIVKEAARMWKESDNA